MRITGPSRRWREAIGLALWLIAASPLWAAGSLDLPALIRDAKPAVVSIVSYDPSKALPGTGTGFLRSVDRIITCRHVLAGCDRAEVRLSDGRLCRVTGIVAEDRNWDLAMCAIDPPATGIAVPPVANELPAEGDGVLLIGGPLGLEWTSSVGIVSALREVPTLGTIVQHTAPISPGNSGGPVLNDRGEVVAVQSATITTDNKIVQAGQSLNFAIPGQRVLALHSGLLKSLPDAAKDVTGEWRAPCTVLLDRCSLRFFSRGDFEGALDYFKDAIHRYPDSADTWLRLGICHEKLGDLPSAAEAYRKAATLDPNLAIALNNLGVVCFRQKKIDEAIGYLTRAIARKPDIVVAYANLADCYNAQGRYDDALASCLKGLGFEDKNANLRFAAGVAYLGLGRKDQAQEQARLLDALDKGQADRLRQEIAKSGA